MSAYLREDYDRSLLEQYERTVADEFDGCGDEGAFYRTSRGYLYNLTAFAMTGTKLPYLEELTRLVPAGERLLDYGCGIGSDGLLLLEAGYQVEFADFRNPSTEYLRWRLEHRGLEAPIHDLDQSVPGGFAAAYAFDVIEHVPEAFEFLGEMERRADLVMVNLLESEPDDPEIHHELPIRAILRKVAPQLVSYRVHHQRSHLIAYRAQASGVQGSISGRMKLGIGRARHALPGGR